MNTRILSFATLTALILQPAAAVALASAPDPAHAEVDTFEASTLSFEPNVGQADERVKYLARARGYTVLLTESEAVLTLAGSSTDTEPQALKIRWSGTGRVEAEGELPGRINYLVGDDPDRWSTGVPTFERIRYEGVQPGVDLLFYGNERNLEYDFVVASGADPSSLTIEVDGADDMRLDESGDLVMRVGSEEVRQLRPVVYQMDGDEKRPVQAGYTLDGAGRVGFALGAFDAGRALVVDPVLVYSTFSGGMNSDTAQGIAVDAAGAVYVTGGTGGNWPTKMGSYDVTFNGGIDAFVTKLDAAGGNRIYSTYLGGAMDDIAYDVAVDAAGCAFVTGGTESQNYPTTPGAFDTMFNGVTDVFVTKLDAAGATLVYSTFIGNDPFERGDSIAIDAAGCAYVTGIATSQGYPTTAGAFDTGWNGGEDAFVTKLNPIGSALVYSTFLGGANDDGGEGIAVDLIGNAYVGGTTRGAGFPVVAGSYDVTFNGNRDAFVTKVNPAGNALVYSTFLGGNNRDHARDLAIMTTAAVGGTQAYLVGYSRSANYPVTAGALAGGYDVIVTALDAAGSALVYSTFIGGAQNDNGIGIAVDSGGSAHITGITRSAAFPTTAGTIDASYNGGGDAFAAKLDAAGALTFSTFLGAAGEDSGNAAAIWQGYMFVAGHTRAAAFPVTAGVVQPAFGGVRDAFVAKIQP